MQSILVTGGARFNDPNLNIDWLLPDEDIIVSEKDKTLPFLFEGDIHN